MIIPLNYLLLCLIILTIDIFPLAFPLHNGSLKYIWSVPSSYPSKSVLFLSNSNPSSMKEEIQSLRVKELKSELNALNIDFSNVFEKEGLVQLLIDARLKSKQKQSYDNDSITSAVNIPFGSSTASDAIVVPMQFYSLDSGRSVAATNADDVFLRPSPGKFPCIQVDIGNRRIITLLVDTACTALVLRPSVVTKYGLPSYSAGATMTAAGGGNMAGALTQIDRFTLVGSNSESKSFGPFPTAVQDIGALPPALDGIIGLSFLSQFAYVDFDFKSGNLILHENKQDPLTPENTVCLGKSNLESTRMMIWAVRIKFDGKGPVKTIVDTGAASTILNWKGVHDMGLSKDSELVVRNFGAMGAMGADNVALDLSHRYSLQRRFSLSEKAGSASAGVRINSDTVPLDIGDLPILEALKPEGIGGLLGSDLLMRCDIVRFAFKGNNPSMTLFAY